MPKRIYKVRIGRTSGPITDLDCEVDFEASELHTVADVLAAINKCTNNKEGWYYQVQGQPVTVPVTKE